MEKIKYGVLGSSKIFHTRKSALTHANLLGYPRSAVFLIIPQGMTQKMIDKVNYVVLDNSKLERGWGNDENDIENA
ncbi:TPA: hypothetical protein VHJ44_001224 [Streptococcus pyogenes]|nr:hypothetical protein [Streptococcus pyogenes]HEQ7254123.1 hypothetical protein [Streptococcus pyogenes]